MKTRGAKVHEINKLAFDEFGRPHGLLLVDKPAGITSHDVVDIVRREMHTRKVGHAGALDVFSSGLLMILVGNATKWSDEILNQEKAYIARIVFGIETETQDPEGAVLKTDFSFDVDKVQVEKLIESFVGEYEQLVSIYSSVKVEGKKLRKILRDPNWPHEVVVNGNNKTLKFFNKANPEKKYQIEVPKRMVSILEFSLIEFGKISSEQLPFKQLPENSNYCFADVRVKCSKGTYIRQLAEDVGIKAGTCAALSSLRRVELGSYLENQAITIEQIADYKKAD